MRKFCVALAVAFAILPTAMTLGQSTAAESKGTIVAVVDTFYVLKKHEKMQAYQEEFNKKVRANKVEDQNFVKELQKEKEKLRELKIGSDESRALTQKLFEKEADYLAATKTRDMQLLEDKMKMEYETYLEVQEAIKNFATRNGIDLVLSYDSEKANSENPESLQRAVRSTVQFQNRLDITLDILKIVNPKGVVKTDPPRTGGNNSTAGRPTKGTLK